MKTLMEFFLGSFGGFAGDYIAMFKSASRTNGTTQEFSAP